MKLVKSANHKSWIDLVLNKQDHNSEDLTFKEKRLAMEKEATQFEANRKVIASKYQNVPVSSEDKPGFREVVSDQHLITNKASEVLINFISNLGSTKVTASKNKKLAGVEFQHEETRIVASHNDIKDNSLVTDKAHVAFAAKFALPGINKYKVAKFVVSFDDKADTKYVVANSFFDENLKEYSLTSKNFEDFLMENDTVKTASEKPLVWFNPEQDTIESVSIVAPIKNVVARLKNEGFDVDENYWVDACYGPKEFGRICAFVNVPLNKSNEFKKIAALSDDDWSTRGKETDKKIRSTNEGVDKDWTERSSEKENTYTHKDYKKGDQWVDRVEEKGKDNPYGDTRTIMISGSKKEEDRKEAVKKALNGETLLDKLNDLEKKLS